MLRVYGVFLTLPLIALVIGCHKSPEEARRELGQLGVPYTREAFIQAAKNHDTLAVKLFLEAGMDPNTRDSQGSTPLITAVKNGHHKIVKLLLDSKANTDIIGPGGWTPLKFAVAHNKSDIVRTLVKYGANVDFTAPADTVEVDVTALGTAAQSGSTDIVQLLLKNGAAIEARSDFGHTALTRAAMGGHSEIVKILLANGADANAKTKEGQVTMTNKKEPVIQYRGTLLYAGSALVLAVGKGHKEVVQILLRHGANVNAPFAGKTPLNYAQEKGDPEIIKLLREAGARG